MGNLPAATGQDRAKLIVISLDEKFSLIQQLAVSQNTSPADCIAPDLDWQVVCRSTCGPRNVHVKNGGPEPQPSSPQPQLHACV